MPKQEIDTTVNKACSHSRIAHSLGLERCVNRLVPYHEMYLLSWRCVHSAMIVQEKE